MHCNTSPSGGTFCRCCFAMLASFSPVRPGNLGKSDSAKLASELTSVGGVGAAGLRAAPLSLTVINCSRGVQFLSNSMFLRVRKWCACVSGRCGPNIQDQFAHCRRSPSIITITVFISTRGPAVPHTHPPSRAGPPPGSTMRLARRRRVIHKRGAPAVTIG